MLDVEDPVQPRMWEEPPGLPLPALTSTTWEAFRDSEDENEMEDMAGEIDFSEPQEKKNMPGGTFITKSQVKKTSKGGQHALGPDDEETIGNDGEE